MIPREETKYIMVTAIGEAMTRDEIAWRGRRYGWMDAGCHYIVSAAGVVHAERAHHLVAPSGRPHNHVSVVVVMAGAAPFNPDMMRGLEALVSDLEAKYPDAVTLGQSDLPGTRPNLPGFDVRAWATGLRAMRGL